VKKFSFILLTIFFVSSTVYASKIDAYKEIILNRRYTIRYDNLTPAPRITNRDVAELYGKSGLIVETNDFFTNRPLSGIVTANNEDKYEEIGYKDFYQCRLQRGGETFIFTHYTNKKGAKEYFGSKKGKVEANTRNYLTELMTGESFGDNNFTEMMNALISDYKFINSGTLDNGLFFEDFLAQDENKLSAIRYYFDGDTLVKISFASYGKDKRGEVSGSKCIVKILEFTNSPNNNLLRLPAGLQDVTKR
jgi:hypothetical protein